MSQTIMDQLEGILEASTQADERFLGNLTEADRQSESTYQDWSAKDIFAHVNFWERLEVDRILQWLETGTADSVPQFEQSNLDAYNNFAETSWAEIIAYSEETMNKMRVAMDGLNEEILLGPSWESEGRKMWESLVQRLYSHKLFHYSEFYQDEGKKDLNSQLWTEWAELVSPLDPGDSWQGRVHYNAACGLALAGDPEGALARLSKSLELAPGMKTWARLDGDFSSLHESARFKQLIATDSWWEAVGKDPQTEAVADQFIRTFTMLRSAVKAFPEEAWKQGESNYQRPVGLALHITQTLGMFSAMGPGDHVDEALMHINWENPDATAFPDQDEFLRFLDVVEEAMARFLVKADLNSEEVQFPWTGSTKLSRALYTLRHTQHHLADMAMELQRRGLKPPDWS